jgi:hypothetical protein
LVRVRWIIMLVLASGCSLIVEDAGGSVEDAGGSVSVVSVASAAAAQTNLSLAVAIPPDTDLLIAMIAYYADPNDSTPNLITDVELTSNQQPLGLLGIAQGTNVARVEAWSLSLPPAGNDILDIRTPAPISAAVLGAFCLDGADPTQPLRFAAASGDTAMIAQVLPTVDDAVYVAATAVVRGDAAGEITLLNEVPVDWNLRTGDATFGVSSVGFAFRADQPRVDATLVMPVPWSVAAVAVPAASSP